MSAENTDTNPTQPDLDLTPRTRPERSASQRWMPRLLLGAIAAAAVLIVVQSLGDASLSFKNVDVAVADRTELGEQRFLMQGTPVERAETITLDGTDAVAFTVVFEDTRADVVHIGAPAETFQPSVPVVLEGYWVSGSPGDASLPWSPADGWYFESTRMLVKHDNEYRVDNEVRLGEAERGGMLDTSR